MVKIVEAAAVLSARAGNLGGLDKMADHLDRVSRAGKQAKASMAGTATDMAKRVGDINAALSRIGNFRTLSRGLDDASIAMRRAHQEAARLKREINATASPTKAMMGEYARASKAVERASAAFRQQGQAVREARAALDAAGIPVSQIAKQQIALTRALDQTTQAMQRQAQAGRMLNANPWGAPLQRHSGSGVPLIQQVAPSGKPLPGVPVIPTSHPTVPMSSRGSMPIGEAATSIGAVEAARRAMLAGADVDTERSQARQAGWSAEEIARAERAANDYAARYGISPGSALNIIREGRPTFGGDLGSTLDNIGPFFDVLTAMRQKAPNAGAEENNRQLGMMVKAGEILGYSSDPVKLKGYADFMTKMVQVHGSALRGEEILNFAKSSKSAGSAYAFDYLMSVLPTMLPELGGDRLGTASMTLRQALVGGKMKKRAAENLADLGIVDREGMISTDDDDVKGVKPSAVKGSKLLEQNPLEWVRSVLVPAMDAKGIAPENRSATLSTLFSDRNAEYLINLLVSQMSRLEKDRVTVERAKGLAGVQEAMRDDPYLAANRLVGGAANVGAALADPWLGPLKTAADAAAAALNSVASAARADQGAAAAGTATGGIVGATAAWMAARGSGLWWRGAAAAGGAGAGALAGGAVAPLAIGAGQAISGAAGEVGAIAAGKHFLPAGPDAFADLREQIAEANAKIARVEARVHPSRRDEFNPDVDALQRHVAELRNRIEVGSRAGSDAAGALGERGRGVIQPGAPIVQIVRKESTKGTLEQAGPELSRLRSTSEHSRGGRAGLAPSDLTSQALEQAGPELSRLRSTSEHSRGGRAGLAPSDLTSQALGLGGSAVVPEVAAGDVAPAQSGPRFRVDNNLGDRPQGNAASNSLFNGQSIVSQAPDPRLTKTAPAGAGVFSPIPAAQPVSPLYSTLENAGTTKLAAPPVYSGHLARPEPMAGTGLATAAPVVSPLGPGGAAGTVEAVVKPDQLMAKLEGSAEVIGRFEVAPSSELIRVVEKAREVIATGHLANGGNGPGSTGSSMPRADAPNVGGGGGGGGAM